MKAYILSTMVLLIIAFYCGSRVGRIIAHDKQQAYRDGVMFAHRCINASLAESSGKQEASARFLSDAKELARYGWYCKPGESLLIQDR